MAEFEFTEGNPHTGPVASQPHEFKLPEVEAQEVVAGRKLFVAEANAGRNPFKSLSQTSNAQSQLHDTVATGRIKRLSENREMLQREVGSSETVDQQIIQAGDDLAGVNDQWGLEMQYAQHLLDESDRVADPAQIALHLRYQSTLAEIAPEGFTEAASDIGAMIVAPGPRDAYAVSQLVKDLGGSEGARINDKLNPGLAVQRLRALAQSLPPEQARDFMGTVAQSLKKRGNKVIATGIFQEIFGLNPAQSEFARNAWTAVDTGEMILALTGVGKVVGKAVAAGAKAYKGYKTVKAAADVVDSAPDLRSGFTPNQGTAKAEDAVQGQPEAPTPNVPDVDDGSLRGEVMGGELVPVNNAGTTVPGIEDVLEGEVLSKSFSELNPALTYEAVAEVVKDIHELSKTANVIKAAPTLRAVEDAQVAAAGKQLVPMDIIQMELNAANEATVQAFKNAPTGEALGVSRMDAAEMHSPFVERRADQDYDLASAPPGSAAEIQQLFEEQDALFNKFERELRIEGVITADRRREMVQEAIWEAEQAKYHKNIRIEEDRYGFRIQYDTLRADENGVLRPETVDRTVNFEVGHNGHATMDFDNDYIDNVARLDLVSRMKGNLRAELVDNPMTFGLQGSKLINAMQRALEAGFKPLNKKQTAAVERIIMKGDRFKNPDGSTGKNFSWSELKHEGLSDKQIRAYFAHRHVENKLWEYKNQQIVDNYIATGVRLSDFGDARIPSRVWDDPVAARRAFMNDDPDTFHINVVDDILGSERILRIDKAADLDKEMLQDLYTRGYRLAKASTRSNVFKNKNGDRTIWALVKESEVHSPRGHKVLNQRAGYTTIARKESYWWVRKSAPNKLSGNRMDANGNLRKGTETIAYAATKAEAMRYVDELGGEAAGYKAVFDRDLDPEASFEATAQAHGGLFSGARRESELKFLSGEEEYESPLEGLQRYINNIAKQLPSHLWRIGVEERILNKAKNLTGNSTPIYNLNMVLPAIEGRYGRTSKEYRAMRDAVDQVRFVSGIPTKAEEDMIKRYTKIGEMMEGYGGKLGPEIAKLFYRGAQKNFSITDQIRGATFVTLLGAYNPAQLVVQASGMAVAFAINPTHFGKTIHRAFGWGILDRLAHDPRKLEAAKKALREKGLGDYVDDYDIWDRSGFRESVTHTASDMATIFGNKPYNSNILQSALANNRFFYEMGEMAMNRTSVATALSWYKSVNKIEGRELTEKEVAAVMKRAETYRLSMSRTNRSRLNEGYLGVAGQFQQVVAKYYSKILPESFGGTDELNGREKWRLFMLPIAMFGAAGVPGAAVFTNIGLQLAGEWGVQPHDLDEETARVLSSGGLGWAMSGGLDFDVDVSSRLTLGTDIPLKLMEFASGGGGNLLETALGPSGNVAERLGQGMQYIWTALDATARRPDWEPADLIRFATTVTDAATSVFSSTRNAKDFIPHILTERESFYKDGRWKWDWQDLNTRTAIMGAMGFAPNEANDLYALIGENRANSDTPEGLQIFKDKTDVLARIITSNFHGGMKEEDSKFNFDVIGVILDSMTPGERARATERLGEILTSPQYSVDNEISKYFMRTVTELGEGMQFINGLLSKYNDDVKQTLKDREDKDGEFQPESGSRP